MDFINFNLDALPLQSVNEMICPDCGKSFVWYQTIINNVGVGGEQPKCPYCGGNKCRSKY